MQNLTDEIKTQIFNNFSQLICQKNLERLAHNFKRQRLFDATIVLKACLFQALSPRHSLRTALVFLNPLLTKLASLNTAALARAKKKLSLEVLKDMAQESGQKIATQEARTILVDGCVFKMFDSHANQKTYPQSPRQKQGLGFPLLRAVCCFCAKSAAFLDMELGAYVGKGQAETTLLGKMIPRLKAGDTLVLDRFYTNFYLLAFMLEHKLNFVVRMRDTQAKKLLGKKQKAVVRYSCRHKNDNYPLKAPPPRFIEVLAIKYLLKKKGFRAKCIYIMSNQVNQTSEQLAQTYNMRWDIEVNFRHLKTTMGMYMLKSKTPTMIEKEAWIAMLAYNLVVYLTSVTKNVFNINMTISFKAAVEFLITHFSKLNIDTLIRVLQLLATSKTQYKYRSEPRAKKNRADKYPRLMIPRAYAKDRKCAA